MRYENIYGLDRSNKGKSELICILLLQSRLTLIKIFRIKLSNDIAKFSIHSFSVNIYIANFLHKLILIITFPGI